MPATTALFNGVEVPLTALFREFVEANQGKVLGVAVGDGAGNPLAAHFESNVNIGRLCGLGGRLLESGAIIGECLDLPGPNIALLKGESYHLYLWRVPVMGGPLVCVVRRGTETLETRFRALGNRVSEILSPPPPR